MDFPDDLYQEAQMAVAELSVNRSTLIRDAVWEYLRRLERRKLARDLAEGYRANAKLNQRISAEFRHIEAENL